MHVANKYYLSIREINRFGRVTSMTLLPKHYDVAVKLLPTDADPDHCLTNGGGIEASVRVLLCNLGEQPAAECSLLLYRLLHVSSVEVADAPVRFSQQLIGFAEEREWQVNQVKIRLPVPLLPGEEVSIKLAYSGPVCGYREVMRYAADHVASNYTLLRMDVLWYPIPSEARLEDFFACLRAYYSYSLAVNAPAELTVIAGGAANVSEAEDGRRVTTFKSLQPSRRMDFAAGEFIVLSAGAGVEVVAFPEHRIGARLLASWLDRLIAAASEWLGPWPAARMTIMELPEGWGGEATTGLITLGPSAFSAEAAHDPEQLWKMLSWAGHELLHTWGPPTGDRTRFIDESLTHGIEALLLRELFGDSAYRWRLESYRRIFLRAGDTVAITPIADVGDKTVDANSRGRGPWAVCVLAELLGGSRLPRMLGRFYEARKGLPTSLQDFLGELRSISSYELQRMGISSDGIECYILDWFTGTASSYWLTDIDAWPNELAARYRVVPYEREQEG